MAKHSVKPSKGYSQQERNNWSATLNPNNDSFWKSRGLSGRPEEWSKIKDLIK